MSPLIRNKKYLTQTAQLKHVTRQAGLYGDTSITSISTVKCLLYTERSEQDPTNPVMTDLVMHKLILDYNVRSITDKQTHVAEVVDKFGNVVLTDARITKLVDYNHWKYKPRFFVCDLDLDMDG